MRSLLFAFLLVLCTSLLACDRDAQESRGLQSSPPITQERTSELFAQANKALIDGEHERALALCEQGLERGDVACHRLIGIVHKQNKDTVRACAAFAEALAHDDPHAITIERYIKHLRCEQRTP